LLVALENVYAVLRSEEPLEPAKLLLGSFVQDFVQHGAGTPEGIELASLQLKRAIDTLGAPALPFLNDQDATWVSVDEIEPLLAREQPRAEPNAAAADLLKLAIRMRREGSWSRAERSKALVALCQKVATANERPARYSRRASGDSSDHPRGGFPRRLGDDNPSGAAA